jgi:transcriptional regulator with XRE-family HTH domain
LTRGISARARFVESHLDKSIAYQIRALRGDKWTQAEFAEKLGIKHPNNVAARLENPRYGKHTLTTLKKIATACDVALVVWFVPFSRLADWVSGTPYLDKGLTPGFYNVPTFAQEFQSPLGKMPPQCSHPYWENYGSAGQQGQDPDLNNQSRWAEAQRA